MTCSFKKASLLPTIFPSTLQPWLCVSGREHRDDVKMWGTNRAQIPHNTDHQSTCLAVPNVIPRLSTVAVLKG